VKGVLTVARYDIGKSDNLMQNGYVHISVHKNGKELSIGYTDSISGKNNHVYLIDEQVEELYEILKGHIDSKEEEKHFLFNGKQRVSTILRALEEVNKDEV
jgi:hypothetical protein